MTDHPDTLDGPHFDPQLFGPGPRRLHKGSKPRKPSAAQLELEKAQLEMTRRQLAEMEAAANMPTPAAPAPLAPLPPATSQSSADMDQAMAEERRKALKRMAPGRSTIFAGETQSTLGGRKTLLG